MVRNADALESKVYDVPAEIDAEIARLKLAALAPSIDVLTPEQEKLPGELGRGDLDRLTSTARPSPDLRRRRLLFGRSLDHAQRGTHRPPVRGPHPGVARGDGGHDRPASPPRRRGVRHLPDVEDVAEAIRTMVIRGAPAIGVAAAMGMAMAARAAARELAEGGVFGGPSAPDVQEVRTLSPVAVEPLRQRLSSGDGSRLRPKAYSPPGQRRLISPGRSRRWSASGARTV